jgi:hypothetical protein
VKTAALHETDLHLVDLSRPDITQASCRHRSRGQEIERPFIQLASAMRGLAQYPPKLITTHYFNEKDEQLIRVVAVLLADDPEFARSALDSKYNQLRLRKTQDPSTGDLSFKIEAKGSTSVDSPNIEPEVGRQISEEAYRMIVPLANAGASVKRRREANGYIELPRGGRVSAVAHIDQLLRAGPDLKPVPKEVSRLRWVDIETSRVSAIDPLLEGKHTFQDILTGAYDLRQLRRPVRRPLSPKFIAHNSISPETIAFAESLLRLE